MLLPTYVAPSKIEGIGVFTSVPIEPGTTIWRFDPAFDRILSRAVLETAPEHLQEFLERYAYPLPGSDDELVLEVDNGRFMNHSASPNTDFTEVSAGYALRNIAADEELTCNYEEFEPGFVLLPSAAASLSANGSPALSCAGIPDAHP
jgi:SET domain-containing protein